MGRNPQRSPEEEAFRTTYIGQHGRSKGASKAWRRKKLRTSGQTAKKTNLVKSNKITTAVAIIPGQAVVDHLPQTKQATKTIKVYNAETGTMDKVEPTNVGVFQKMFNAWGVMSGTKTGRR